MKITENTPKTTTKTDFTPSEEASEKTISLSGSPKMPLGETAINQQFSDITRTIVKKALKKCCANCGHPLSMLCCPVCGKPTSVLAPSCRYCGAEFENEVFVMGEGPCPRTRYPDLAKDKKSHKRNLKAGILKRDFCEDFVLKPPLTKEQVLKMECLALKKDIEAENEKKARAEDQSSLEKEYQRLLRVKAGEEDLQPELNPEIEPEISKPRWTHGDAGFRCSGCDFMTPNRNTIKTHFRRAHMDLPDRQISTKTLEETSYPDRKIHDDKDLGTTSKEDFDLFDEDQDEDPDEGESDG